MKETWVQSLGWEDPLEEGVATCSSILAQRIQWTENPWGLESMGLQRVRYNWSKVACIHALKRVKISFTFPKNIYVKWIVTIVLHGKYAIIRSQGSEANLQHGSEDVLQEFQKSSRWVYWIPALTVLLILIGLTTSDRNQIINQHSKLSQVFQRKTIRKITKKTNIVTKLPRKLSILLSLSTVFL